jgi:hypothetical protein
VSNILLVTSSPERAVWLSFAFYLLNLLVPIVPAVIIYWLFPEGKTKRKDSSSIEGSVGGWKIKAVGAFGAYVTAFVLGLLAINSTAVPLIKKVGGASIWTIDSDFKFVDEQGKDIGNMTADKLIVEPPMVTPWGPHATIKIFSETLDPPDDVHIKMEGYQPAIVALSDLPNKDGKIKFTAPIVLTRLPDISSGPAPTPLPATAGPAVVTAPAPSPSH